MPFLEDQELANLQKEINDSNARIEGLEEELDAYDEENEKKQRRFVIINIMFACMAGIALAYAYYSSSKSSGISPDEIATIKKKEQLRVIDSLNTLQTENLESEDNSIEGNVDSIRKGIKGETVYSVQVRALTERKYPLLSQSIAGMVTNDSYFKYSVGLFKSLQEAQSFRKQLVKIGFRDAFIASYIDGERQEIHKPY